MSRRSWLFFLLLGFIWGIPYLLIRVAVEEFTPATLVFLRLCIGALILMPIAIHRKTLTVPRTAYKFIALYSVLEIIGPWFLITNAERNLTSGLTGLLLATVPIWSVIFTSVAGDKTVWHRTRLLGLIVGFIGVVSLVGLESLTGHSAPWAIGSVLLSSVGYAYAVIMIRKKLPEVSGIAINAIALVISAIVYAPFALQQWPTHNVSAKSIWAVVGLGALCTALAFILFFEIMYEIGPARTSFITYLNTGFAVVLGVLILGEPVTVGIVIGLPLVLVGSYFATRRSSAI
ncbi:MAG: DMT family transporter [Actinobacteria bacterium]|nr:DMT family transporter [Actinomycetota bacterium]